MTDPRDARSPCFNFFSPKFGSDGFLLLWHIRDWITPIGLYKICSLFPIHTWTVKYIIHLDEYNDSTWGNAFSTEMPWAIDYKLKWSWSGSYLKRSVALFIMNSECHPCPLPWWMTAPSYMQIDILSSLENADGSFLSVILIKNGHDGKLAL